MDSSEYRLVSFHFFRMDFRAVAIPHQIFLNRVPNIPSRRSLSLPSVNRISSIFIRFFPFGASFAYSNLSIWAFDISVTCRQILKNITSAF